MHCTGRQVSIQEGEVGKEWGDGRASGGGVGHHGILSEISLVNVLWAEQGLVTQPRLVRHLFGAGRLLLLGARGSHLRRSGRPQPKFQ